MKKGAIGVILLLVVLGGSMIRADSSGKYAGTDNCKLCHPDIYNDWSKTPHARSFELLVNVGEEKNPQCLPCHSTAYGKGGFVDAATSPGLKGTTCEACHGPGGDHMGNKTKIIRTPPTGTCAACHQKNNIHSVKQ